MKLVIVESPAKAKTIEKYLGKDYTVKASKGHIVDLPKSDIGVDVEDHYKPKYEVTKPAALKELKSYFKGADELVIATDPDREGEAIGWHIAQQLGTIDESGKVKKKFEGKVMRIVFTEITKDAVQHAVEQPRAIDMDLVDAQQARRVLDRLVGYKLSPLLWKKIRFGLSAGRVQSVAVRLIVDREREREAFKPEEYWSLDAYLNAEKPRKELQIIIKRKTDEEETEEAKVELPGIKFELVKIDGKKAELVNQGKIDHIIDQIKGEDWKVADVKIENTRKFPSPPFSTSTLQQAAANRLGFSSKRTMSIAQKLYEAGQITYMRTDSLHMAADAITAARKFISSKYGEKYLPATAVVYKVKSKVAQEAHEAVRPTNFSKDARALDLVGEEAKLYDLIRARALSSQMSPALLEVNKVTVDVAKKYTFQANGSRILFKGYLELYPEKVSENELPKLTIGQELYPSALFGAQHFTQPPARYSEASLIKKLEELGIGRPSTYAPTIQTIQTRQYVIKEGKYFLPTDTGRVVTDLLVKHFPEIVDVGFTADMEDKLDTIANGKLNWVKMMDDFYKPFAKNLGLQDKNIQREDFTTLDKSDQKCPICGKPMVVKLGRYGRFLSCSDFPNCKGMMSVDGETEEDIQNKVKEPEFQANYEPAPKTDDGKDYLLKKGRYGEFWAHPNYPKVKDAKPLVMQRHKIIEVYGEIPKTDDGRDYLLRNGKFGKFWAHPDYPKVKDIIKVKKQDK